MTCCKLSARVRAHVCAPRARFLFAPLTLFVVFGHTAGVQAQTRSARPVARLIGTVDSAPKAYPIAPEATASCATRQRYAHASARASVASRDEHRAFELINDERRARGLMPLRWDDDLAHMARDHSEEMGRGNFLAHVDAAGRDTFARAALEGVCGWSALGENIAYNQGFEDPVAFAVERWMQSVKHRDNILRPGFTHAGLGIAKTDDGRIYFTQVFVTR